MTTFLHRFYANPLGPSVDWQKLEEIYGGFGKRTPRAALALLARLSGAMHGTRTFGTSSEDLLACLNRARAFGPESELVTLQDEGRLYDAVRGALAVAVRQKWGVVVPEGAGVRTGGCP